MAEALGISYISWQDYERGKTIPGGKVFESLVKLGFDANWLLIGEGPMMRGEAGEGGMGRPAADQGGDQGAALDPQLAELLALLERYGSPALIAETKRKLLQNKKIVEGG